MDRGSAPAESPELLAHVRSCVACRELRHGFRLLQQGLVVLRTPEPAAALADRIVRSACIELRPVRVWTLRRMAGTLAAAAAVALVVWGALRMSGNRAIRPTSPPRDFSHHTHPAAPTRIAPSDAPLFPELARPDAPDSRDQLAVVGAVDTMSELVVSIGRNLTDPVPPITRATTGAVQTFWRDISPPGRSAMPGMPMMPMPPRKPPRSSS
jgi:hypothetical protein